MFDAFFQDPHVQTVWPPLFRPLPQVRTTRETWPAPDGDIDVEVMPGQPQAPVAVVLHGMEGSSQAHYVRGLLRELSALGWSGVAVNFRSCGPSGQRTARTYHAGDTR